MSLEGGRLNPLGGVPESLGFERARNAKPALLADLYGKALVRDPASCDALWGAIRTARELGTGGTEAKERAQAYVRLCPRAPHADEARRISGG